MSDADYRELSPKVIVIIIIITNLPKKEEDSAKEGDQLAGSQHGATLSAPLKRYLFFAKPEATRCQRKSQAVQEVRDFFF